MSHTSTSPIHALRVATAPFSKAEGHFRGRAGIIPAALAPGFHATARHDLIYHGGRTLSDLKFFNFFVGGAAGWAASDIKNINTALAAAMTDAHLNNVVQQYFHTAITSEFLGSSVLAGAPPSTVSQGDVEAIRAQLGAVAQETGLPVIVAEDPLTCVARGGGRALEMMDKHTMDLLSSE